MLRDYTVDDIKDCPVASVQKIVSGKWTMVIVYYLSKKTLRFGALQRCLG